MKIQLLSKKGEYGFNIVSDSGQSLYCSPVHYFLTPDISPSYRYAWEAYRDARRMIKNKPYHLAGETTNYDSSTTENQMTTTQLTNVSAEQMLVDHYMNVLDGLKEKARNSRRDNVYADKVYQEVKLVIKELMAIKEKITDTEDKMKIKKVIGRYKGLVRKYFPKQARKDEEEEKQKASQAPSPDTANPDMLPPMPETPMPGLASSKFTIRVAKIMDPESDRPVDFKDGLMEEYSENICRAIQDKHPNAYYHYHSPESDEIVVMENEEPIIVARMNKYLGINSIAPAGKLKSVFPIHSAMFYHKYWKPIVKELKHFCTSNPTILIIVDDTTFPDGGESNIVKGWNIDKKSFDSIDIGFRQGDSAWMIGASKMSKDASAISVSKYTEQDYINAIVKCVDPKLESIYGRTGAVIQVMPGTDLTEIDVDFGRGLGTVRLTENQIEIVPV